MQALLVSTDLMATSAADGAARAAGISLRTVPPAKVVEVACETLPYLVAIDLTASIADLHGLVDDLCAASPGVRLVAYGPHVHEAKLEAAKAAGCDMVISRGQFHKGFGEILARYAAEEA